MIELRESFTLLPSETDSSDRLRPEALQKRWIHLSLEHSRQLGCGWDEMRAEGVFWVLSRLKARILRFPKSGEIFSMVTWPNPMRPSGVWRNYVLETAGGETVAEGMALWAVLDLETGKPRRGETLTLWNQSLDYRSEAIWDPGILPFPSGKTPNGRTVFRVIRDSDIDANGHVNNLRYLTFVEETLATFQRGWHPLRAYQIYHYAPLFVGETVAIHFSESGDLRDLEGEVLREGRSILAFRCRIE